MPILHGIIPAIAILIAAAGCSFSADAAVHHREKYYQEKWCREHGGVMEFVLPDGARVDCLTETHAVEFDFAKKWAEGHGQAKYYAAVTGKRPAVALIAGEKDGRYIKRLRIAAGSDIDIFVIEK